MRGAMALPRCCMAFECCFVQGCPIEECGTGQCTHPCCLARLYDTWDRAFEATMRTVLARAEAQAAREGRYFRTFTIPGNSIELEDSIELEVESDDDCDNWVWGPPSLFQVREQLGLDYL